MSEGNEPPDHGKGEPTEKETESEDEQGPAPLNIHQCGENIRHVAPSALGNVGLMQVALTILEDHTLPHPSKFAGHAEAG